MFIHFFFFMWQIVSEMPLFNGWWHHSGISCPFAKTVCSSEALSAPFCYKKDIVFHPSATLNSSVLSHRYSWRSDPAHDSFHKSLQIHNSCTGFFQTFLLYLWQKASSWRKDNSNRRHSQSLIPKKVSRNPARKLLWARDHFQSESKHRFFPFRTFAYFARCHLLSDIHWWIPFITAKLHVLIVWNTGSNGGPGPFAFTPEGRWNESMWRSPRAEPGVFL